jgi:hypothetical protein
MKRKTFFNILAVIVYWSAADLVPETTGTNQFETGTNRFETGINQFETGINQFETGINRVETGTKRIETGRNPMDVDPETGHTTLPENRFATESPKQEAPAHTSGPITIR